MALSSLLRLANVQPARWDAFHQGRIDAGTIASDPVLSRWGRAAALRVRSEARAEPEGVDRTGVLERRGRLENALGDWGDLAGSVVREAAADGVVAVLADADGVIVHARAGAFTSRATEARLVEGAQWTEGKRGTNAIGTALYEGRSVAVVGGAHYERANHALFCYAAPIQDPYGNVVGVFDVTGDVGADNGVYASVVLGGAACCARALRAEEYASAVSGGLRVVERMLDRCASPGMLIEAPGVVRRMNAQARALLGLGADEALTVERLFDTGWSTLAREAVLGNGETEFATQGARYALQLDPVMGRSGRVLAVLAYFDPPRVPRRASHAREVSAVERSPSHPAFEPIVGNDPAVLRAKELAARLAPTEVPVLLLAETGTGKELFAQALHRASARAKGPFVAINCGALSPTLLESELFGYAPGAFTGARTQGSEGRVEAARGGTLFLDEVGEMPAALQALLLRLLEDGSYTRVGEGAARRADFRLVCATCRDLPAMVSEGAFRSDLFFRIQGASVTLPTIRERSDRVLLAEALLEVLAREAGVPAPRLAPSALRHVRSHDWPGNVRELKSALRHALLLASGRESIEAEDFPAVLLRSLPTGAPSVARTRGRAEADALDEALRAAGGNLSATARLLRVSRGTLYRMLERAGRGR